MISANRDIKEGEELFIDYCEGTHDESRRA
jgi:SET domain-containing protein